MYLKLSDRISPKQVCRLLLPEVSDEEFEYDYENVYEWAYIDMPGVSFSLDVTRDHGMSDVDDDALDMMSAEEIETLPTSGPTYIFGWDRGRDQYVEEIPESLIRLLCATTRSDIVVYPGRIHMGRQDPQPVKQIRYEPHQRQ